MLLNPCPIIDIRKTVEDDTEQQKAMEDAVQILDPTALFGIFIGFGRKNIVAVESPVAIEE